ncbi:MAG: EamA family transporter [Anaerolineales bacterium]
MSPSLLAALFALAAAVTWGTGDFANGLGARRVGAFHALLVSFYFGFAALIIAALILAEPFPRAIDLFWGVLAGLAGTAGFLSLLQGFATGRMSIVAPVSAVVGAGIPVMVSIFTEGLPREIQLLGFTLAFVSIWILTRHESDEKRPAGIGLALLAGAGFGAFFTLLDQISESAFFWPLVVMRLVATLLLMTIAFVTRRPLVPAKAPLRLLATAGLLDVAGNMLFLQAVQTGRLDVAAVLVSLYPAVTVMWAALIAKEHLNRLQLFGVVLAVAAIALITI